MFLLKRSNVLRTTNQPFLNRGCERNLQPADMENFHLVPTAKRENMGICTI